MKKVKVIKPTWHQGATLQPGQTMWVQDWTAQQYAGEGRVEIMDVPQNRIRK